MLYWECDASWHPRCMLWRPLSTNKIADWVSGSFYCCQAHSVHQKCVPYPVYGIWSIFPITSSLLHHCHVWDSYRSASRLKSLFSSMFAHRMDLKFLSDRLKVRNPLSSLYRMQAFSEHWKRCLKPQCSKTFLAEQMASMIFYWNSYANFYSPHKSSKRKKCDADEKILCF